MNAGYAYQPDALAEPTPAGVIAREDACHLSVADFVAKYEATNLPAVISGCAEGWAAAAGAWQPTALYQNYRHRRFKCGEDDDGRPVKLKLKWVDLSAGVG